MAEVKVISVEDAKEKTQKAIKAAVPGVINSINNAINAAAGKGENKTTYQNNDICYNTFIAAVNEFKKAGYYTNVFLAQTVEIQWQK